MRKASSFLLVAAATAIFLIRPTHAQTSIHVAPCGDDDWSGLSEICEGPDGPKGTIEAGIEAAGESDTVVIAPGDYPDRTVSSEIRLGAMPPVVAEPADATQSEPDKLAPDLLPGVLALAGVGGPDPFGYRWIDSDQAGGPAFSWNDIAATGTVVSGLRYDDENVGPIPIGFDFPFYGNTFNSVRVSTNGWISFTSTSTAFGNRPLPDSGAPENLIALFWDDLHFRDVERVTYQNFVRSFVVQFTGVDRWATGSDFTFQVELRSSGEIRLRYLRMTGVLKSQAHS
jgi:hypothetical protein